MSGVVVTGVGTLGCYGAGLPELARALESGRDLATPVDRSDGHHRDRSSTRAARVTDVDLREWIPPAKVRRLGVSSRYAVAAARMALRDAGMGAGEAGERRASISLGTAFGSAAITERLLAGLYDEGPEMTSPALFTECVANAPAAQIALFEGIRGPAATITQREASPILALARGLRDLQLDRSDLALVAAVDEITPLHHATLDRLGALAGPRGSEPEAARPFDRRRDGFLMGEGATVMVLEPEDVAAARGARPRARVRLCVRANDPTATTASWGRGEALLGGRLTRGLREADLTPGQVDRVVSGASGSRAGDRLEAGVLRALFDDAPLPPILAPKAVHGEYGGGVLAAAVLAASGAPFGPTPGFRETDPELGVAPHDGGPLPAPERVLVTGLAAGGSSAWALLERP